MCRVFSHFWPSLPPFWSILSRYLANPPLHFHVHMVYEFPLWEGQFRPINYVTTEINMLFILWDFQSLYDDFNLKFLYIAVDESSFYPKRIGSISKLTYHPLSGDLWAIDDNTLEFNEFTYDGQGPDAFFIIGLQTATSTPNPQGIVTR